MKRLWIAVVLAGCGGSEPTPTVKAGSDADPCDACAPGQRCVERFDGTCQRRWFECVNVSAACPDNACTPECQRAYCPQPFTCTERVGCANLPASPKAFTCYGP